MRRGFFILPFALFIASCNRSPDTQGLQKGIDSLVNAQPLSYKPGFGEFMSGVQAHHSKLWFAAQSQNWKLATFEIHEIDETLSDIQHFQKGRKESKMVDMLFPVLSSLDSAVQQKNSKKFKDDFILLTATCNDCHKTAGFDFIRVKIPETSPFTNQEFKVK